MTKTRKNWGGRRAGAGRPKSSTAPLRTLSIRVTEEFAEKIRSGAKKHGLSQGQYIMILIDNVLG